VTLIRPGKRPINEALLIRSDNVPVTLRHPGKRSINEALMIRSANYPVNIRHPGKRHQEYLIDMTFTSMS
jgi:hypothetical protein